MEIRFFCPIWGMVPDYIDSIDGSLEEVLSKIRRSGYDGVEMAIPRNAGQKKQLCDLISVYGLDLIALQWASNGKNIREYLKSYEEHILSAAETNPVYINCHSGKDYFSYKENCLVIDKAIELEKRLGIQIIHEVHRSRFTFHAYGLQPYLNAYPGLRLAADFSHWCNVSESYLQDQPESVNNAIERAIHIHARVGHPQACQVSDPRAPEWQEALNFHLQWWDAIVENRKKEGATVLTITPEFGPGNYMPLLPFTKQPVANQWNINLWVKELLKKRYQPVTAL